MKKKIILSSILALGVLGGVVGLAHNQTNVNAATPEILYLKPEAWTSDNARFAAYFFGNGEKWESMTDVDGDGVYEVSAPAGYPNVIFCRMDPSTSANNWNNKWNQSVDLTIPTDGKNCWTFGGNWDTGAGTWGTYTYVEPTYYLPGSFNGWDTAADQLTDEDKNGTYEVTKELEAGTYTFKVALNGTWATSYGTSTTATNNDTASITLNGSDNVSLTATGGTYTFAYTPTTKNLTITHVPADTTNEDVCNLLTSYYNEGTYTRNTTINLNTDALDDISTHFHGSVVLERTTYFTPEALWMTRGETETNYSYYGTSGENMTTGSATEVGIAPEKLGTVTKDHKDWDPNGKDENGMEGFYITLKDIMEKASTVEWTYSNGVYSTNGLTEEFLAFTAPCLLDTQNYVQYIGVEVEEVEVGETLVLRLLASETNSGALSVETNVLSQATITK